MTLLFASKMVRTHKTMVKATKSVGIPGYYDYYHRGPAGDKVAAERIWARDKAKRWNAAVKAKADRLRKLRELKKNKHDMDYMEEWRKGELEKYYESLWTSGGDDYHDFAYLGETSTPEWVEKLYD